MQDICATNYNPLTEACQTLGARSFLPSIPSSRIRTAEVVKISDAGDI